MILVTAAALLAVGVAVGIAITGNAASSVGVVLAGTSLTSADAPISSPNGDYRLLVNASGQLTEQSVHSIYPIYQVLYSPGDAPTLGGFDGSIYGPTDLTEIWQRPANGSSPGAHAIMQPDGNLVLYGRNGQLVWASNTAGNPGAHLVVQDDANIVIYSNTGRTLWQSGTTSVLDAIAPGATLRMCPWQAGQGVVGFTCSPVSTVPDSVGVTMLCWISAYTPPAYGNYPTDKWFYVSVDGKGQRGFIHASLITASSQIPTPPCQISQQPTQAPTIGTGSTSTGGSPAGPRSVTLAQGPAAPSGYRYAITLSGFGPYTPVSIECFDSTSPGGFYSFVINTDANGSAYTDNQCYSADGPQHWVTADGVMSNKVAWLEPGPTLTISPPPTAGPPPLVSLDADATPAFGTCPSNPPPANEAYCGGWSNSCNTAAFSKSNCPVYVDQGTSESPVCWTTGQTIYNNYSAASPGPTYTLQSNIWIKVANYSSSPWMSELWFNPDNTASDNLPHC